MAANVLCCVCKKTPMVTDSWRHNVYFVMDIQSYGVCSRECKETAEDPQMKLNFWGQPDSVSPEPKGGDPSS